VIEVRLPGAIGQFRWKFDELSGGTRITQRASINGEQAQPIASAMAAGLESGIPRA